VGRIALSEAPPVPSQGQTTVDVPLNVSFLFASSTMLTSAKPSDENTLEEPKKVAPDTRSISGNSIRLPAYSVTVLRVHSGL